MEKIFKNIGVIVLYVIIIAAFDFLLAFILKYGWNNHVSVAFGFPKLTYWQSFWLFFFVHGILKTPNFDDN